MTIRLANFDEVRPPTPYSITFTFEERKAIDWIGGRYSHGDDLAKLLTCQGWQEPKKDCWGEPVDITFHLTENQAWGIQEIVEQDSLACFSDELKFKFYTFLEKVV
jgi:hypothetical protein